VSVQVEIEIAAPREEVFELLLDPSRLGEWVSAHRGVDDIPAGKLREGSEFRQTLSLAGSKFHVRWKVVELDRPSLAVWEGRGPAGSHAKVAYVLSESDSGTTFRYCNQYGLPGGPVGAVAGKATAAPAKRAMKSTLRKLKRLLESERG
jgi:uncharacterized protein YndB with AHSA1/START domain